MIVGLSILTVLLFVAVYHAIATAREARDNPPPGKLVDVGSHRLHIYSSGEGGPVVVMDTGIGGTWLDWVKVQPEIAELTRVCSYDRAGYGWSEFGSARRTSQQVVDELRMLLTNAGIEGPYVLVGHSLGALGVRLFARQYADEVAAVVLVDAVHEDLYSYLPTTLRYLQLVAMFACRILSSLGLLRLGAMVGLIRLKKMLLRWPVEERPAAKAILQRSGLCRAAYREIRAFQESAAQVSAAGSLGDMPLIVLSAGRPPHSLSRVSGLKDMWRQWQAEMPELSTNSIHIVVEDSRHTMPYHQPEAVVDAIRRAVEMVRR